MGRVSSRLLAREACGFQKSKNQPILEDLTTWLGWVARLRLVSSLRIAWLLGEALPRVSSPTCKYIFVSFGSDQTEVPSGYYRLD